MQYRGVRDQKVSAYFAFFLILIIGIGATFLILRTIATIDFTASSIAGVSAAN